MLLIGRRLDQEEKDKEFQCLVLRVHSFNGLVAQLVRAPPCHGGGHRFKSDTGRAAGRSGQIYADVAQLAEQLICNQQVIGSIPIVGF